jgi:hypothetical protein
MRRMTAVISEPTTRMTIQEDGHLNTKIRIARLVGLMAPSPVCRDGYARSRQARLGTSLCPVAGPNTTRIERPLCAMSRRCRQTDAHARVSLSNSLISRNSRSARSASASSKGRSCRHCSDRRKSQAGRNSASRHRTRNNLGLDRYTKDAGCGAPCAKPKLSGRKLEGCYSVADDSPAGSRSRASVAPDVSEPAQPARRPAAAIGR